MDKVRFIMTQLTDDDLKDKKLLFEWLFEKFRNWSAIKREVERIKDAPIGSRRRNFSTLWAIIERVLSYSSEDQNHADFLKALQGQISSSPQSSKAATAGAGTSGRNRSGSPTKASKDKKKDKI